MDKLHKAYERFDGDLEWMISELEIEDTIVGIYRWHFEVHSVLDVDGEFYGVTWYSARQEDGMSEIPSLDEFTKLTRVEHVTVERKVEYVEKVEKQLKVDELKPVLNISSIKKTVDGIDNLELKLEELETILSSIEKLGSAVGLSNHHAAFNEYIANIKRLLEIIE